MKIQYWRPLVAFALMACLASCVELTGQRISWFYDQPRDELRILIHYDGVHDSGHHEHGEGAQQLGSFVEHGDILFLDWPFHLKMNEAREVAQDPEQPEHERQLAELIASGIKASPIGRYQEPGGSHGAAQLVAIPNASGFVKQLNGLINGWLLDNASEGAGDDRWSRTFQRAQAAAQAGHAWFRLSPEAITLQIPVDEYEWALQKGRLVKDFLEDLENAGSRSQIWYWLGALSSGPISYTLLDGAVEFSIRQSPGQNTLRFALGNTYEPSLEEALAQAVPADLDQAVAQALLGEGGPAPAGVEAVMAWGPAEDQPRALIHAIQQRKAEEQQAAVARLEKWAQSWNQTYRFPPAPEPMEPLEDYLAAWSVWYRQMKRFPMFDPRVEEEPADEGHPDSGSEQDPQQDPQPGEGPTPGLDHPQPRPGSDGASPATQPELDGGR